MLTIIANVYICLRFADIIDLPMHDCELIQIQNIVAIKCSEVMDITWPLYHTVLPPKVLVWSVQNTVFVCMNIKIMITSPCIHGNCLC